MKRISLILMATFIVAMFAFAPAIATFEPGSSGDESVSSQWPSTCDRPGDVADRGSISEMLCKWEKFDDYFA